MKYGSGRNIYMNSFDCTSSMLIVAPAAGSLLVIFAQFSDFYCSLWLILERLQMKVSC